MTMVDALSTASFVPRDYKLGAAVQEFIRSGGTIAKAHEIVDVAAKRMPSTGHSADTKNGQMESASARHLVEGERGHLTHAAKGHIGGAAPPSSNRGGDGHGSRSASSGLPPVAAPVREPSVGQRSASAAVAKAAAITVMDTLKIDGRAIGDWTVSEARNAGRLKSREGYILIEASRMVANAKGNETLRSVVKEHEMQKIMQRAAEVADAV